ncbi:carbohydrate phosphatase [Pleomassaria siparia CBS 279.74]|uniref:Carbohydrate phosphatase n=1 Tax=Pleomassaria siparia CBS 279.74 TaxID=1314801 RepID=A0A6G1KDJ7_9PLEO|nr:carbohydrate phosphatase [Pleomassaria siparia CBS 279.74]
MTATPLPYTDELTLALRAIHAASLLTKSVLRSLSNHVSAETKADDSPVTIADFAAQAILISALHAVYPSDAFLGEESAAALRENKGLAEQVWQLVLRASPLSASETSDVQKQSTSTPSVLATQSRLTFPTSKADMLDLIDRGTGTETARGRVWVMDPVDGTATFMEGKQYAVCLCLLVDGVQQVAAIGAPNLKFDASSSALILGQNIHEDLVDEEGHGVVLSAIKGHGTYVSSMHASNLGERRRIDLQQVAPKKVAGLNFIESTLGVTSLSQGEHQAVAESLGASWPGTVIWSQQMKYVALTLGATDVMVRLPKNKERFTCVWDHAGGQLLFEEAGGIVKDLDGGAIDFAQGRKILGDRNYGMIAAMPWCFDLVMQTVQEVLDKRPRS